MFKTFIETEGTSKNHRIKVLSSLVCQSISKRNFGKNLFY